MIPPHEQSLSQTTNRPRNGGHWWSTAVTGGPSEPAADLGKPWIPGVLVKLSRAFTRQRPLVRNQYRPPSISPGQRPIRPWMGPRVGKRNYGLGRDQAAGVPKVSPQSVRPALRTERGVPSGLASGAGAPHSGTLPSQDRSAISVVPWSRASTYCPEGSGRGGAGTNSAASGASRSSASSSDGPVATMLIGLAGLTGLGILLAVPAAILTSAVMPALFSGLDRGDSQPPLG